MFTRQEAETMIEIVPSTPFDIQFMVPVHKVLAGALINLLLTADGEVWAVGTNENGELGINDPQIMASTLPVKVKFPAQTNIIDIGCETNSCLAADDKGQVYVWGQHMSYCQNESAMLYQHAQLPPQHFPRLLKDSMIFYNISRVFCGMDHTAVVSHDSDAVLFMGSNECGQQGFGAEYSKTHFATHLFRKQDYLADNKFKIVDVALGSSHSIVLVRDLEGNNRVFVMGEGAKGQLGHGGTLPKCEPCEITIDGGKQIVRVGAGAFHSLFLTEDGKVYGCGKNTQGELGLDSKMKLLYPTLIPIPGHAYSVEGGSRFSAVLCFRDGASIPGK